MSRIGIFGAGAIGGLIGAKLWQTGEQVSMVARGPHLAAMQANGVTIQEQGGGEVVARPVCTSDPAELGIQDYLFITLKAHAVSAALDSMEPLIGSQTAIVWAVNGLPWWYFYDLPGPWKDHRLASIDPGNLQWDQIGPQRIIGCVVYPAAEVVAPGIIRHVEGDRLSLGEPGGEKSERIVFLSKALTQAGFRAPVRSQIRNEVWVKLWGNLAFNPISALTGATLEQIATNPGTHLVARQMMVEAEQIAEKLSVRLGITVDQRIEGARGVGAHKTSMLQDLERERPMEIDALVTVVQELGRLLSVATPTIDAVLALLQMRARTAGLYP